MNFTIQVAGLYIKINSIHKQVWYLCRNYICKEKTVVGIVPDLVITSNLEELSKIKTRISANPLQNDGPKSDEEFEVILIHQKITEALLDKGILLIHGSTVVTDNKAYMIVAPSGTGKTYRSLQWLAHIPNSYFLNGDKPYVIVRDDVIYACGSPWCGKERFSSNKIIPLQAIFFLERSDETVLQKLSFNDIFTSLIKQTYMPSDNFKLITTLKLLKQLNGKVDFYRFYSTKSSSSVIKAYETASGKSIRKLT